MNTLRVAAALQTALGLRMPPVSGRAVGGGSINQAVRYETERGPVFVKLGELSALAMFQAEAAGLEALAQAAAVRVPQVMAVGADDGAAFLALEWIEFGPSSHASEAALGEQLAQQHRTAERRFGWSRDNTIGSTPQPNAWCDDWVGFLRERRLGWQLDLAQKNGADVQVIARGRRLCELLDAYYSEYTPIPSLLHGDLWGGNWAAARDGQPVVFDPAVYYGDREADIAMTRLFGGFGSAFYSAYRSAWPLDAGADARTDLHNLYHVLNHFNLFGGGYLRQARSMIDRLLTGLGH